MAPMSQEPRTALHIHLGCFQIPAGHVPHSRRILRFCKLRRQSVSFCTSPRQSWWPQVTCRAARELPTTLLPRKSESWRVLEGRGRRGRDQAQGKKDGWEKNRWGLVVQTGRGSGPCNSAQDKCINLAQGLGKHPAGFPHTWREPAAEHQDTINLKPNKLFWKTGQWGC